jgi:hypothetical protein
VVVTESVHGAGYARTRARWDPLAQAVRDFDPTAIVLVARKAPRVVQALDLELGHHPLMVTDTGLEFVADQLNGARVAIIDDIINVGSTLRRARSLVEAAGAAEIRVFALARRGGGQTTPATSGDSVTLVDERPLDVASSELLASEIPMLLQGQALPYDLDFPVMRTRLNLVGEVFASLYAALTARYGAHAVYDISSPAGARQHVGRLVVTLPTAGTPQRKVRLYIDEDTAECNVVPISLGSPLDARRPDTIWAQRLWDTLDADAKTAPARAHLNFFIDSLSLGLSFVAEQRELFCPDDDPFDVDQASLIFGPKIAEALTIISREAIDDWLQVETVTEPNFSPFLQAAQRSGLINAVKDGLGDEPDELSAFIGVINTLADWVGANDPAGYRLGWPYDAEQIAAEPYERLRIGPTFGDLSEIIATLTSKTLVDAAVAVSRLLDRFIDEGGVVPTTACYEDRLYRIYRKGEKDPRDEVALRLRRAWGSYGEPLSLTRASKLAAILSFSEDRGRTDVAVKTRTRGNVACYASSVLDDETEITHQLRRTGQLRRADTT